MPSHAHPDNNAQQLRAGLSVLAEFAQTPVIPDALMPMEVLVGRLDSSLRKSDIQSLPEWEHATTCDLCVRLVYSLRTWADVAQRAALSPEFEHCGVDRRRRALLLCYSASHAGETVTLLAHALEPEVKMPGKYNEHQANGTWSAFLEQLRQKVLADLDRVKTIPSDFTNLQMSPRLAS